jgi:CDP-diacylglycerol--glycerol-3-phosphate 3-phosphatidyltransferase
MIPAKPDPVGDPINEAPIVNLPNALTLLRLLCVPIFIWLYMASHDSIVMGWAADIVFLAAALTDIVDGHLARRDGLVTNFGKIADPIADKLLTGSALIALSLDGAIAWWITILIIGREVFITALRFYVIRRGVIPASRGGKAKTASQITAIVAVLIPTASLEASPVLPDFLVWLQTAVVNVALVLAVVLTVVTAIDYIAKSRALLRQS